MHLVSVVSDIITHRRNSVCLGLLMHMQCLKYSQGLKHSTAVTPGRHLSSTFNWIRPELMDE